MSKWELCRSRYDCVVWSTFMAGAPPLQLERLSVIRHPNNKWVVGYRKKRGALTDHTPFDTRDEALQYVQEIWGVSL